MTNLYNKNVNLNTFVFPKHTYRFLDAIFLIIQLVGEEYYIMYCTRNERSRIWKLWGFRCKVKVGKCHLCCDKNEVHILLNCSEMQRWTELNQKWSSNNKQ
jgi:hypothetical protein